MCIRKAAADDWFSRKATTKAKKARYLSIGRGFGMICECLKEICSDAQLTPYCRKESRIYVDHHELPVLDPTSYCTGSGTEPPFRTFWLVIAECANVRPQVLSG